MFLLALPFWFISEILEIDLFKPRKIKIDWKQRFKRGFEHDCMLFFIQEAPKNWGIKAWKKLRNRGISDGELLYIIRHLDEPYKTKAKKIFKSRHNGILDWNHLIGIPRGFIC